MVKNLLLIYKIIFQYLTEIFRRFVGMKTNNTAAIFKIVHMRRPANLIKFLNIK